MYLSGSVMGKTGFTLWIGLACLWAVVAALVITLLPPGEAFLRKGNKTLPPVQLESVVLQQGTENPVAAANEVVSRSAADDATDVSVAANFLDSRQQQQQQQQQQRRRRQQPVYGGRGGFVPEEAEL
jgi:hypothetical protein